MLYHWPGYDEFKHLHKCMYVKVQCMYVYDWLHLGII